MAEKAAIIPEDRAQLIETAVRFMNNARIVAKPFADKVSFLKKKGLTEEEIQVVCQRANVSSTTQQVQQLVSTTVVSTLDPWTLFWKRLRNLVNLSVFLAGTAYGAYYVWKRWLAKWLGIKMTDSSKDDATNVLREEMATLRERMDHLCKRVEEGFAKKTIENTRTKDLDGISSDIQSIKGLLLSSSKFPSNPTVTPIKMSEVKDAIPKWQLASDEKETAKIHETHSGSTLPLYGGSFKIHLLPPSWELVFRPTFRLAYWRFLRDKNTLFKSINKAEEVD